MKTISIALRQQANEPLYQQLYQHLKEEISSGRMPFGTKLPSKKQLENSLNISQTTIETAYAQLQSEGYIESVPRKGYFVSAKEGLLLKKRLPDFVSEKMAVPEKPSYDYDFTPGQIDTSLFPFRQWRRLYREAICEENQHLLRLGQASGEESLREEIRSYLYQSRGVVCSTSQIIIGAGIEQLLPQLVFLLGGKSSFAVENPGYPLTRHVLSSHQRQSSLLEVDCEGAKVELLQQMPVNVVYVTPSHQFPLGSVMSVNRRSALLKWASADDSRYIIEDDYDSEFRYYGRPIPSLYSLSEGRKVIYLSTFSKSLIPSLRIGFMVLPEALVEKYRHEFSYYASCVSRIDQYVLAQFMGSGAFARHLNRMRLAYRKKIELIVNLLEPCRGRIQITGEAAGLHLLLSFTDAANENELIRKARAARIRVIGLSSFYHQPTPRQVPGIVLGFGRMNEKTLAEGLGCLLNCWLT